MFHRDDTNGSKLKIQWNERNLKTRHKFSTTYFCKLFYKLYLHNQSLTPPPKLNTKLPVPSDKDNSKHPAFQQQS